MAMTEQEWLACTYPLTMLDFLQGRASNRKLRLYMCAWAIRLWRDEYDERSLRAIAVAEQFADGLVGRPELMQAFRDVQAVCRAGTRHRERSKAGRAAEAARDAASVRLNWRWAIEKAQLGAATPTGLRRCQILREIVGLVPFRPTMIDPAWRTSNVTALAQSIYDDRAFDRLPILADALEDAGCDNADILNRCRQPGDHVRGCWVVDLILGKS
jgi:hypothetical protein